MRRTAMALAVAMLGAAGATPQARACGVSAPGGVSACSLEEHAEATRPRWRVGASGLYTSTSLRFAGSWRGDETRRVVLASLSYAPSSTVAWQGALGATLGGDLETPSGTYHLDAGPIGAVGASWRPVTSPRLFVVLSTVLSVSTTSTHRTALATEPSERYTAFDLRVGGAVGTTVLDRLGPYALARVFGGPVSWRYQGAAVTGTDTHHYQLGGGLALLLSRHLDLFAEGAALGERALSVGLSGTF